MGLYLQFRAHVSGQRNFYNFCLQLGKIHTFGSPCVVNEWKLCLFATFLVKHSTLKVYLVLCIHCISTWAFLMLLLIACNCSEHLEELQQLKVILLVTSSSFMDDLMVIIFRALDMSPPDHCMIWAACQLEFFGFLSPELMVPKLESFSLAVRVSKPHLRPQKQIPFIRPGSLT